jgi:hypothetical protein
MGILHQKRSPKIFNLGIDRDQIFCSLEIIQKTLTLLGASLRCDDDVLPVRKIIHFQLTQSVSSSCALSPNGGLVAQEGGLMFEKRFSHKNRIKQIWLMDCSYPLNYLR